MTRRLESVGARTLILAAIILAAALLLGAF